MRMPDALVYTYSLSWEGHITDKRPTTQGVVLVSPLPLPRHGNHLGILLLQNKGHSIEI